ncbi:hypothetical protein [Pedobacter caeni]|uniref:Uncharacterized protein n=1 Tax=Pedobacter caeni TaxID=288992 RepID=A0A1M5PE92_9SPHI|nr:hypothetical protein [Pedobacter caeni]SHH00116.1 hypothetical protein SAMN04488522_109121 [Pedobacter caeni]
MKRILYISCVVLALSACNSSPKQTQSVITPTPAGLPSASTPVAATGEKPANNPAHGQPYHDCALPVGAPLNAKNNTPAAPGTPVAVPATPVATQATPVSVTTSPATTPTSVPKNQKEVRLNPAHGQPGHSCAIAVGAPLT